MYPIPTKYNFFVIWSSWLSKILMALDLSCTNPIVYSPPHCILISRHRGLWAARAAMDNHTPTALTIHADNIKVPPWSVKTTPPQSHPVEPRSHPLTYQDLTYYWVVPESLLQWWALQSTPAHQIMRLPDKTTTCWRYCSPQSIIAFHKKPKNLQMVLFSSLCSVASALALVVAVVLMRSMSFSLFPFLSIKTFFILSLNISLYS